MGSIRPFVKSPLARSPLPRPVHASFCVHCARNLDLQSNTVQPANGNASHLCAEKLLSWEPASPLPYS
jgi:hypothetical protein